ncbi:uncharacterized protein MELLADRAFT_92273 [Melampsora larici-populina 98AG31]|uniref:OTU domain-containing protein n=1 Tax=Melampsora larici-populina (strain 98AG31 / pathotype 3-4-7) TaxID=747676 RepID=F4R915_MELLP|nr:uncharacterized protein MELLADRAFT_92273 [Melampsora larici-populina 98AG31]EGG11235.1 hypothetical protein MELLADRAFT_92273 [Melampsora larici-populina 98AG31]
MFYHRINYNYHLNPSDQKFTTYTPYIITSEPDTHLTTTQPTTEARPDKHVFPVPKLIEIQHKDRRKMDEYIASFPATQHGYRIRIGRSQPKTSPVSHYECYRSGYPKGIPAALGTSKSLCIDCPFKLSTRWLYEPCKWILIYTHLGHNHPPDPDVKPRKRFHDPKAKPILAPGVVMDDDKTPTSTPDQDQEERHPTVELGLDSNVSKVPHPQDPMEEQHPTVELGLDSNVSIVPHPQEPFAFEPCSHDIDPFETVISTLTARLRAMSPRRKQEILKKIDEIINDHNQPPFTKPLPLSFTANCVPSPSQAVDLYLHSPNKPQGTTETTEIGMDHAMENEESQFDKLLDDLYGPSEVTNSTFNIEDLLISQPTFEPVQTSVSTPPLCTPDTQPPSALDANVNTGVKPDTSTMLQETSNTSATPPGPFTRKRAREEALLQKPNLVNPTLPALLTKYSIRDWLVPSISDIREVKADGHCGFRAISVSLGHSQDNWSAIRQSMLDTINSMTDILTPRTLPEPRAQALARLATNKPNVVSEQQYWLTMPGWGGIIATTFNRPVLYYEPGVSNNRIFFPYHSSPNLNPPIVIIYANYHFASVLLDFTLAHLPIPRVCPTWQRFAKAEASGWLDTWQSHINEHTAFLNTLKPRTRRKQKNKAPQEPTVVSD